MQTSIIIKCRSRMKLIQIFNSVHTDKCSECGGIWLDTGELETLSKTGNSVLTGLFRMFQNDGQHTRIP